MGDGGRGDRASVRPLVIQSRYLAVDLFADSGFGDFQVIASLEADSYTGCGAEVFGKPQSSIGSNFSLSPHDLTDTESRDTDVLGDTVLAQVERLYEVLEQDLARMYGRELIHGSELASDNR